MATARARTVYRCADCGGESAKWAGRCATCGAWNTLSEERAPAASDRSTPLALTPSEPAQRLGDVDRASWQPCATGIGELDRVLGGGFVRGSVTLLGGEPGIGKSTLLLQLLAALAREGQRCLLVSGEESVQQVRLRAERLLGRESLPHELWLAAETELPIVLGHVGQVKPAFLVIDSIQTMLDPALESSPGVTGACRPSGWKWPSCRSRIAAISAGSSTTSSSQASCTAA